MRLMAVIISGLALSVGQIAHANDWEKFYRPIGSYSSLAIAYDGEPEMMNSSGNSDADIEIAGSCVAWQDWRSLHPLREPRTFLSTHRLGDIARLRSINLNLYHLALNDLCFLLIREEKA